MSSIPHTDYDKLLDLLRQYGMDFKWSRMFVKKLKIDEENHSVDDATRRWALERGFFPGRVELYGLKEENYHNYLPDFSYFMIHPINHHFKIWINDKLTLKYVLNSCGCEESMPEYYLYVENNGDYTYMMDAPKHIAKDENFLLNLLKDKKALAAKPNSGASGGRGFMKWVWTGDGIEINNKPTEMEEFLEIIKHLENYVVTEYAHQHEELASIWPASECTLRVTMAKLPHQNHTDAVKWCNITSNARFGSSISGGASNVSAGGIGVGFDFETGRFKEYGIRQKQFCENGDCRCYEHPDTHVAWKDRALPNWTYVKSMIERICQHISSLDYLGLDIIITQDGMKFCEINSHPAMDYIQVMCQPALSTENSCRFFEAHGLYKVNTTDFCKMYQECQG